MLDNSKVGMPVVQSITNDDDTSEVTKYLNSISELPIVGVTGVIYKVSNTDTSYIWDSVLGKYNTEGGVLSINLLNLNASALQTLATATDPAYPTFGYVAIPANTLRPGDVLRFESAIFSPATAPANSKVWFQASLSNDAPLTSANRLNNLACQQGATPANLAAYGVKEVVVLDGTTLMQIGTVASAASYDTSGSSGLPTNPTLAISTNQVIYAGFTYFTQGAGAQFIPYRCSIDLIRR